MLKFTRGTYKHFPLLCDIYREKIIAVPTLYFANEPLKVMFDIKRLNE